MRVLIVLSIVGLALAHPTVLLPSPAPVATSYNVVEPRAAFEYSASVQTGDYTNYASVKSDNAGLVATPVSHVLTESAPVLKTVAYNSAPVVRTYAHAAPAPLVAIRSEAPVYSHAPSIVAPHTYDAQYTQHAPAEEERNAFEYSSSVQTADYANYASVKSDSAGLVAAPVAHIQTASAPAVAVTYNSAPIVQSPQLFSVASPVTTVRQAAPAYFTQTPAVFAPQTYAAQYTAYQPREAFEYSSSVQTADYANYASVKSDSAGLVSAPVALRAAPAVHSQYYSAPAPLVSVQRTVPVYSHAPAIVAPQTYAAQYAQNIVQEAPAQWVQVNPAPATGIVVEQPTISVHAATPIVETVSEQVILNDKSQYHSQDSLGQAAYGHSEALQTHNAIQDAAGNKAGSYSYVAPDGRVLTTDYIADENGYRVATNALPVHAY